MFIATQIALAKRLSPHNADARLQLSGLRYTDRSGAAQLQDVPPAIAPLAPKRSIRYDDIACIFGAPTSLPMEFSGPGKAPRDNAVSER